MDGQDVTIAVVIVVVKVVVTAGVVVIGIVVTVVGETVKVVDAWIIDSNPATKGNVTIS